MAENKIYSNIHRIEAENQELYVPGGFHPVHLGDILNGHYRVFRKLGAGSQATIWLAKDTRTTTPRFVAIKVFRSQVSKSEIKLDKLLQALSHPGKQHVELALESFMVEGPNGHHFCKVLEPLGCSLYDILGEVHERRAVLNAPKRWLGIAVDGDGWSIQVAKRACWQILLGLDYLHSQGIAHRDIQPANICAALRYDINSLNENEIQGAVWYDDDDDDDGEEEEDENDEEDDGDQFKDTLSNHLDSSSSDSDSDTETNVEAEKWNRIFQENKRLEEEQWAAFEAGDLLAEPHSVEWNKANFFNSRQHIEMLKRQDKKPLLPDEIRYTVAATPLARPVEGLDPSSRLVLVDLGFSCPFSSCPLTPLVNLSDFQPPEFLLSLPATPAADIYSLGLLFYQIVMIRRLVESYFIPDDPGRVYQRNRKLHDLVHRLGPMPPSMLQHWGDKEKWVNEQGIARGMLEIEEEEIDEENFGWGDLAWQASRRKPIDMGEQDLEGFVQLMRSMLAWEPEKRPSTKELLAHEWFKDVQV